MARDASHRRPLPSQDFLQASLDYDEATGLLRWKHREDAPNSWNAKYPGRLAFRCNMGRYWQGHIGNKVYFAHRIVWRYVHGTEPAYIDHIDGNGFNNAAANLREASASQSNTYRQMKRSASGMRGVSATNGRWRASIRFEGPNIYLGTFDKKEDARAAYVEAAKRLHGDFMRIE